MSDAFSILVDCNRFVQCALPAGEGLMFTTGDSTH
jgi:hypothetical protein